MSSDQRYEIFQKLDELREPAWVESATDLENAVNRTQELMQTSPADYFVLEHGTIKWVTQLHSRSEEKSVWST